jgi:hypothetical protein
MDKEDTQINVESYNIKTPYLGIVMGKVRKSLLYTNDGWIFILGRSEDCGNRSVIIGSDESFNY